MGDQTFPSLEVKPLKVLPDLVTRSQTGVVPAPAALPVVVPRAVVRIWKRYWWVASAETRVKALRAPAVRSSRINTPTFCQTLGGDGLEVRGWATRAVMVTSPVAFWKR